ncbi:MAG: thioredoxin-dependent thiol peroxidase [Patescibacteria group bacterium]|nr:thioredoxin-dependent thiol peroxidase [Patescibacteria group bacterium]
MKLKVDQKAPDFNLSDRDGEIHKLSDYKGEWLLIYFYPKDDTPGCTIEACELRDNLPEFNKLGVRVIGISTDSVASHAKFSEKYKLPFTLLSDSEKKTVRDYDVWGPKKFMGREFLGTKRTSFLVNPDGKIAKIYVNVQPKVHVSEVLKDITSLKNKK